MRTATLAPMDTFTVLFGVSRGHSRHSTLVIDPQEALVLLAQAGTDAGGPVDKHALALELAYAWAPLLAGHTVQRAEQLADISLIYPRQHELMVFRANSEPNSILHLRSFADRRRAGQPRRRAHCGHEHDRYQLAPRGEWQQPAAPRCQACARATDFHLAQWSPSAETLHHRWEGFLDEQLNPRVFTTPDAFMANLHVFAQHRTIELLQSALTPATQLALSQELSAAANQYQLSDRAAQLPWNELLRTLVGTPTNLTDTGTNVGSFRALCASMLAQA